MKKINKIVRKTIFYKFNRFHFILLVAREQQRKLFVAGPCNGIYEQRIHEHFS